MSFFFFFNDTATTEIYTLSLHDALPICSEQIGAGAHYRNRSLPEQSIPKQVSGRWLDCLNAHRIDRSEEHTSELQSRLHLVCRLLLEKKKHQSDTLCSLYPNSAPQHARH